MNIFVNIKNKLTCPGCGKDVNACVSSHPSQRPPEPGDLSVCIYCKTVAVYTSKGFRKASEEETKKAMQEFERFERMNRHVSN